MWTHINEPFLILFRFWVFQLIYHFLLILNKDLENSLTTVLFYAILVTNGRNAYVMEYDPKYVDVIIKRWEDFTGKKAKLIED